MPGRHGKMVEAVFETISQPLLVLDGKFRVTTANPAFLKTFKVGQEETTGTLVYDLGNGQWDIPELRRLLEDILPSESSFSDFEVEHEFQNVGRRIMSLNARRLDHIDRILLAIQDITELRAREARKDAFIDELQHRVKNILNNVSVLAHHTGQSSSSLDGFLGRFELRLGALARAQDLLMTNPTEAVSLLEIVGTELGAVGAEEDREFTVDGPTVRLRPRDAQTMAMVIHELTTNAAKYGALSTTTGGKIDVRWRTDTRDEQPHLCFEWRERGVEIEDTHPRRGFGSQVIEKTLPYMLGGSASLTFHPDGAECIVEFALVD